MIPMSDNANNAVKSLTRNVIAILTDNQKHSDELTLNYKLAINACTGVVGSAMIGYLGTTRRHGVPDDFEPTLDKRNEQDEASRSQDTATKNTELNGHQVAIAFKQQALQADILRYALYQDMLTFADIDQDEGLLVYDPRKKDDFLAPNYNQPMSLETYLSFRISGAKNVTDDQVRAGIKILELGGLKAGELPEAVAREILQKDGEKQSARLASMKDEILNEVAGWNPEIPENTSEAFDVLPPVTQLRIAEKVAEGLDREYQRLVPIAMRKGSLDVTKQMVMVKRNWDEIKIWTNTMKKTNPKMAAAILA